jgi:molecular chaperone GrpE
MTRKKERAAPQGTAGQETDQECAGAAGISVPVDAPPAAVGRPETGAVPPPSGSQDQLPKQLEEARQKAQENFAILQRVAADYENFKKFAERERAEALLKERSAMMAELIDVMENLERAIDAGAKEIGAPSGLMKGLQMTLDGMRAFLQSNAVRPIEAVGKPFDPALHEAVCFVTAHGKPEYTVAEEFRRGYTINGRVLRISKVSVVSRPELPECTERTLQPGHDHGEKKSG